MRMNRSPFKPKAKGGYRIENKADEATVYIYDEISWWGISAQKFVEDLDKIEASTIHVRINSPGGAVFDGVAIYNAIKQKKTKKKICHIDGLAASIASIIALGGDEVRMGENAFLMIHEPWSIVIGMADDMRKEADLLDKVSGTLATTYMNKTGKSEAQIKEYMAEETWFTAQEALEAGFIDVIDKDQDESDQVVNTFDLSVFANVPDQLRDRKKEPTVREAERALRDVGYSEKKAKAILAKGLGEDQREVDTEQPQRDVAEAPKAKKDKVSDLLIRAELVAPSH